MPPARPPAVYAPVSVPFYNWTGVYVGLNGGYGWGTSNWDNIATATGNFAVTGALIGGTVGFNAQWNSVVLGLEGDLAWANLKGSTVTNCAVGCETRVDWLGTMRARAGLALDRFMPYLTAGGAFGSVKASASGFSGATETNLGWTVGGGVEYAFMGPLSAKVEYLYVDLGKFDCSTACATAAPLNVSFTSHILRAGLNYRF
jgi:outer membrane immunogenic protein